MRSSTKPGAENNRGISGHLFTLHQRLYHALNLGLRSYDDRGWKWYCTDIEIQRLAVRSIDAFLDCISNETSQHPLVKDSVADIVKALESILLFKNESVLKLASKVAVKIVNNLPNSVVESHVVDLVHPLSASLSSSQLEVTISCAAALSLIISRLTTKREREVWDILKETKTTDRILCSIREFPAGTMSTERHREMVSLLSKILWRWPPSRLCVWNDGKLMDIFHSISLEPDFSVKIAILRLYSAIALCGHGAKKLLENGETVLQLMVNCMDSSNPCDVRMEGFRLAGCFAISEQGRLKMMKIHRENLVKAVAYELSNKSLHLRKVGKDQMSLLVEACRLAKITCWSREHHNYIWKTGIESVLLNLLGNFHIAQLSQQCSSLKGQIAVARNCLSANFLLLLRPYIWDILGGLAAHGTEDTKTHMLGNELHLNILITCACLAFVDSLRTTRQICQIDVATTYGNESASRSVLLMIYSPCKCIASQAKCVLSEILKPNAKEDIRYLLNTLNATSSGDKDRVSNNLQLVVTLIGLACYSGLPQYWRHVMKNQGINILSSFIRWWLRNPVHVKRLNVAPHLHNHLHEKTCCSEREEDWEGEDMLLLFGLWGLAELVRHSALGKDHGDVIASQIEAQLVTELQKICINCYASGPRWYAAYLLSFFGLYGFPTKLGESIGRALNSNGDTTLTLILANQEYLSVHGIIITVRCPSLLPSGELPHSGSLQWQDVEMNDRPTPEVRLSAHVDHQALLKLMEYIYLGYLQAGEDLVKKLKIFAKHCNLQSLLQMLCRRSPKWGDPMPIFELTSALGQIGCYFSDITLEAKTNKLPHWTCDFCSQSVPHLHVHKVILCLRCNYLQALFQSGMQESQSKAIKVDVSWEALVKLVNWFYSDDLPKPMFGCLWKNLDIEGQLYEVEPYVELYCLSECWLLEDLHEECSRVIISCLDSARYLSIKIIKLAANCFQWDLAEIAANYMAPLYHHLRSSGELETLDEELVDMVRAASVRLSQEGSHQYS